VPITHTNAKGQTFALYQGTTKTGKPKYYFAMRSEGTLAKAIPAGYEIYENPNAQVFLRRIPPKISPTRNAMSSKWACAHTPRSRTTRSM
jgi:hypothetical protein